MPSLADLKDQHLGETIWVFGSGPSLSLVSPNFFSDKVVVSTNFSAQVAGVPAQYVFSHYHRNAASLINGENFVVTLTKDTNTHQPWAGELPANLIFAEQDSYDAPGSNWNPLTTHPPPEDSLAYGSSSLHGAMHLAAWLGALHIVLVGADCGVLDGANRIEGYPAGHTPWALYNDHHQLMKAWLAQKYGVGVYSLNPFINFNLEGHTFEGV